MIVYGSCVRLSFGWPDATSTSDLMLWRTPMTGISPLRSSIRSDPSIEGPLSTTSFRDAVSGIRFPPWMSLASPDYPPPIRGWSTQKDFHAEVAHNLFTSRSYSLPHDSDVP